MNLPGVHSGLSRGGHYHITQKMCGGQQRSKLLVQPLRVEITKESAILVSSTYLVFRGPGA